jgi:hypothetical protein
VNHASTRTDVWSHPRYLLGSGRGRAPQEALSHRLSLRPEAMAEIREAAQWYAERGLGLEDAFLDEVSRVLRLIRSAPSRYPFADADLRPSAR